MATGSLVSIGEYLSTSYDPDCDYVDGVIEERNLGEIEHASLQGEIYFRLRKSGKEWGVFPFVEQRVQVSPTRFRIPDVCVVVGGKPLGRIITMPPLACFEILSPDDRMTRVRARLDDYLRFGVPYVFLLDPETRKAYRWTTAGMTEVMELRTENPEIVIQVAELFEV